MFRRMADDPRELLTRAGGSTIRGARHNTQSRPKPRVFEKHSFAGVMHRASIWPANALPEGLIAHVINKCRKSLGIMPQYAGNATATRQAECAFERSRDERAVGLTAARCRSLSSPALDAA